MLCVHVGGMWVCACVRVCVHMHVGGVRACVHVGGMWVCVCVRVYMCSCSNFPGISGVLYIALAKSFGMYTVYDPR